MNDQNIKNKREEEKQEKPRYGSETERGGHGKQAAPSMDEDKQKEAKKEPREEKKY